MTNQDNIDKVWQEQMKEEMENSELTDLQKLEIAQKVENAKNDLKQNSKIKNKVDNNNKEVENLDFEKLDLHNSSSQTNSHNLEKNSDKLEDKIKLPNIDNIPKNSSKIQQENQSDNIKINFQVSHIYIFIFIGITAIILNIAVWNLTFEILNFLGFITYLLDYLIANRSWNSLGLNNLHFGLLNSTFLRSLMMIIFVYFNYKIHTKFLTKIFGELEIK